MSPAQAVLEVADLRVDYRLRGAGTTLRAVDGVSFHVGPGETFGLIGESGSGKSTVARAVMRLAPITTGTVTVGGLPFHQLRGRALRAARRNVQMVFQDPHESLDPRMTVRQAVAEPLVATGAVTRAEVGPRADALLAQVELDPDHGGRHPHALSGGQRQRVNIARALALDPPLLICDEAVSALDLSVQAGILNLLLRLQEQRGLAYLFISHDLAVVAHVADRVGVMYLGQLVEVGATPALVGRPRHPYTEALLAAEPHPVPPSLRPERRLRLQGDIPSPLHPPSGCRFRTRCPYVQDRCAAEVPSLREVAPGSWVACHFADELSLAGGDTT